MEGPFQLPAHECFEARPIKRSVDLAILEVVFRQRRFPAEADQEITLINVLARPRCGSMPFDNIVIEVI